MRMRGNCTPVVVQCADNLLVSAFTDAPTDQDHQIAAAEQRLLSAETFADQPFYPVALNRVTGRANRNHRSQARLLETVGGSQYRNEPVAGLVLAMLEHPLKLARAQQAATTWETCRHKRAGKRGSGRQAGAAFGSTSLDDKTAVLGAHPGTEAVVALALQVTGLKGSLHGAIASQ